MYIYVVHEENEIICARATIEQAIAACMTRLVICEYSFIGIERNENFTEVHYQTSNGAHTMYIEETFFKNGI